MQVSVVMEIYWRATFTARPMPSPNLGQEGISSRSTVVLLRSGSWTSGGRWREDDQEEDRQSFLHALPLGS